MNIKNAQKGIREIYIKIITELYRRDGRRQIHATPNYCNWRAHRKYSSTDREHKMKYVSLKMSNAQKMCGKMSHKMISKKKCASLWRSDKLNSLLKWSSCFSFGGLPFQFLVMRTCKVCENIWLSWAFLMLWTGNFRFYNKGVVEV